MLFLHIPVENLTKFVELFFFVNIHPSEMAECSSCVDKLPQFTKTHEKKNFSQLVYFFVCCYNSEEHNQNYEF